MKSSLLLLLGRIKIGFKHQRNYVNVPRKALNKHVLDSLKRQGYVVNYKLSLDRKNYIIYIKVLSSLNSFLSRIRILSKPSRPLFLEYKEIIKKYKPSDFLILSTSRGILVSEEIFFFKVGGELICDSLAYK